MNDVNKNLGHATAYGYAKSKGYTGTEEEFAALMADYAEVGQRAEAAATAAAASATAASGSASDSAASASAAEGSSTAASTAAGNASQAAQTATTKASEAAQSATAAAGSATTASTKATEAAQSATQAAASATTAESAKTAAQTAQTAAETAKTAAETAQGAAEDAAESVSASAAQIAQNTADISSVKNALGATLITDEASGAIATFTDGADGVPMESVTVQMEPIQDLHGQDAPYPGGGGKNLLDVSKLNNLSQNGVTVTLDNGAMTFNGTATARASFAISNTGLGNDTYTFSFNNSAVNADVHCSFRNSDNQYYSDISTNAANQTATFTNDPSSIIFYVASGTTLTNFVIRPQLEKGSTATTFAPYSNICPISGRSEVGVWRSGKNLLDISKLNNLSQNGVTVTLDNGAMTFNGTATANAHFTIANTGLGNDTYTFSFNNSAVNADVRCSFRNSDNQYFSDSSTNVANQTATFTNEPRSIIFYVASGTTLTNFVIRPQLEKGSTATSYEAPNIQQITVQLGQTVYGGTVDAVSGVMTVTHKYKSLTDTWTAASNGSFYIDGKATDAKSGTVNQPYAIKNNLYPSGYNGGSTHIALEHPGTLCTQNLNGLRFIVYDTSFADVAAFNAYVTEHPFEVCYELAQPIPVQLDPQTLTSLLGMNNVWSDGGNVSVEYVADTKAYIAKVIAAALA